MEQSATTNAGLHDQQFALQWIRDHIAKVNGDPSKVTFWGSDAGAASALFHLTAYGGTRDPLFQQAILQSPAYFEGYNRTQKLKI